MAGGGRTVFEFTGSEADREHRGSRGTFMGATLDLSNAKEERENNLRSGASTWIFAAVAVALIGGIVAYLGMGKPKTEPEEPAAVAAAEPTPPAAAAEAKADAPTQAAGAGAEPAAPGEPVPADAKAPAEDAKAVPAEPDKPAEPAAVDPPAEPKPTKSSGTKSSGTKSSGTKSSGTKSTGTKPKTEPKDEPKPSGGKTLKPKKPPRDPLGNLPPPP